MTVIAKATIDRRETTPMIPTRAAPSSVGHSIAIVVAPISRVRRSPPSAARAAYLIRLETPNIIMDQPD